MSDWESVAYSMQDKVNRLQQENNQLKARVGELEVAVTLATIGSCTCATKTPYPDFHDEKCKYRCLTEALNKHPKQSLVDLQDDHIKQLKGE